MATPNDKKISPANPAADTGNVADANRKAAASKDDRKLGRKTSVRSR